MSIQIRTYNLHNMNLPLQLDQGSRPMTVKLLIDKILHKPKWHK